MQQQSATIYSNTSDVSTPTTSLHSLVQTSSEKLMHVKAVYPFTLFPDEVVVTRNQVDIVYRTFFFTNRVFPIQMKDILNVVLTNSPFFSALTFEIRGYEKNPRTITYLPKSAAQEAQQLIMGIVTCYKHNIDISKLSAAEILQQVATIGAAPDVEI